MPIFMGLLLPLTIFAENAEMEKSTFPLVFEFSDKTEGTILSSPIKTMLLLLSDTSADYHAGLLESFKKVAEKDSDKILYVVVPKDKEPLAVKKYFGGIDYDPAVFLVNRETGEYARPFDAFTDSERKDMLQTLEDFKEGFFENLGSKKSVVQGLTDDSFDEAVKVANLIMVEFYAPWCAHCKKLAPEYEKAAVSLSKRLPPLPLAKVDATSNPELKKRFAIETFPTLKLFTKGSFVGNYDGVDLTSGGIIAFMNRYSKAPASINTVEDAVALFKSHMTVAIGIFSDTDAEEMFAEAGAGSDHAFGKTTSKEVMAKYRAVPAADDYLNVIIFRKWDRQNQFTTLSWTKGEVSSPVTLREGIEQALWPLVMQFQRDPVQRRRIQAHPVKDLLLMVVDKADFSFHIWMEALRSAAKKNNERMLHLWADTSDTTVLKRLGFKMEELPGVLAFNPASGKKGIRYKKEDITVEELLKFTDEYFGKPAKDEL